MPDRINLDDPDDAEPEDELEFPAIAPQRFTDAFSGVVVTFEVIEGDNPKLIVVHGDPNEEVFHRYKLEVPEQFLFGLATDFIEPLRRFRELEDLDTAERMRRDNEEILAELATRPFRAASTGVASSARDYDLRVHLRNCHHALNATKTKPRGALAHEVLRDDLPLVNGMNLISKLTAARKALEWCYSPRGVQSNASRAKDREQGRVRHTVLDYQPVRFCNTCKPLGDDTTATNATLLELATLTQLDDTAEQRAAVLFGEIEQALWLAEQKHLDTLRGKGNGDTDA